MRKPCAVAHAGEVTEAAVSSHGGADEATGAASAETAGAGDVESGGSDRDGDVERDRDHPAEGASSLDNPSSRRGSSLLLITKQVVEYLRRIAARRTPAPTAVKIPGQFDEDFFLVDIAPMTSALRVRRRRLYDVLAVLECLDVATRLRRNTLLVRRYVWPCAQGRFSETPQTSQASHTHTASGQGKAATRCGRPGRWHLHPRCPSNRKQCPPWAASRRSRWTWRSSARLKPPWTARSALSCVRSIS